MKRILCICLSVAVAVCLVSCDAIKNVTDGLADSSIAVSAPEGEDSVASDNSSAAEESLENESLESSESVDDIVSDDGSGAMVSGFYSYTVDNGVATLCGYSGSEEEVILPAELDGYDLTVVGERAFYGNASLKKLTVSATVASIKEGAFANCNALEQVVLESGVAVIEADCFDGCTALKEITVSKLNGFFKSVDGVLFSADGRTLVRCPQGFEAEEYTVPEGTELIGKGAFKKCGSVKSVILCDGCNLSESAFFHCDNLTAVTFATGIDSIPSRCFFGCVLLEEISLPEGVESVGEYAFFGCIAAKRLSVSASVTSIADNAFECCTGLEEIEATGEYGKKWYEEQGKELIS